MLLCRVLAMVWTLVHQQRHFSHYLEGNSWHNVSMLFVLALQSQALTTQLFVMHLCVYKSPRQCCPMCYRRAISPQQPHESAEPVVQGCDRAYYVRRQLHSEYRRHLAYAGIVIRLLILLASTNHCSIGWQTRSSSHNTTANNDDQPNMLENPLELLVLPAFQQVTFPQHN